MTRASVGAAITALAACRPPTVASGAASARRAATATATRSAPRRSAAPTVATTPACASCVEQPAANSRTSTSATKENAVRTSVASHVD